MKLDCNFYGLQWIDGSSNRQPIGLINTVKFVDDAPTKTFAITNLKEVDFMNNTWVASLLEIRDSDNENNEPTDNDLHNFDYYFE
jgi:hypothetical protein